MEIALSGSFTSLGLIVERTVLSGVRASKGGVFGRSGSESGGDRMSYPGHRTIRHSLRGWIALVALCGPLHSGGAAAEEARPPETVSVTVDNAKVIRLPERTQTVIVGNPVIADVSMQKNGVVILTGKGFGTTNLIALDGTGAMLAESAIRVEAPQASIVTVQRGLERESYSCTPKCQPSMQLGDSTKYFGEVSGQTEQRRQFAIGATR